MEKTIRWLAVLLGTQLLVALGFGFSGLWLAEQTGAAPLIPVAQEQIDRITLEGPDEAKVVLAKQAGVWRLPEANEFPADSSRVDTILRRLTGMKTGAPIATTTGAQARFKVYDAAFERRITLGRGGETLAKIYLGTSPGLRRSHARADSENAIYAVELATYDVPIKISDWEDKTILQLPKSDITAIEIAGLRLEQSTEVDSPKSPDKTEGQTKDVTQPSTWEAKGLKAGERLQPEAADNLVGLVADLTFDEVLGRKADTNYGLQKPLLELTLTTKGGDPLSYRLGQAADKEKYTLKVSNRPEYFRIPSYKATPLVEAADREQLLTTIAESTGKDQPVEGSQ